MVFTGIVEGTGIISKIIRKENLSSMIIQTSSEFNKGIQVGASVCVDGVCLTATKINLDSLEFDVIIETLNVTTFGDIRTNSVVNIERSMKLGDEIGGHMISGHVFDTVIIKEINKPKNNYILTLKCNSRLQKYIFSKGYISLNGISLTIGEVDKINNTFTVYLIPETLRLTNIIHKVVGDSINIEIETQTRNTVDTILEMNKESIHG
ncbi:MAG: riboflavin synthase subunit alpha [Marine Group III euryarchaeote CG-Epi2]|uniref:Riboflavin synthase n=1 Tax=Marine Group III euryarchaeote CG-Epi2 TaxID=1888996 RepID=A0A1J5U170_9ARCH|nr:MAG: riboflavin synthase subunit alpha [Marine Group III euryarchaeote CG-Epi2]